MMDDTHATPTESEKVAKLYHSPPETALTSGEKVPAPPETKEELPKEGDSDGVKSSAAEDESTDYPDGPRLAIITVRAIGSCSQLTSEPRL